MNQSIVAIEVVDVWTVLVRCPVSDVNLKQVTTSSMIKYVRSVGKQDEAFGVNG